MRVFIPPTLASFDDTAPAPDPAASKDAFRHGFQLGREEGLEAGHREALAAVTAEHEAALARLQRDLDAARSDTAIAQAVDRLLAGREADLVRLEAGCRRTVAAAFRTLFPVLLAREAGGEIAALAADALALVPAVRLALRAHPDTLAAPALGTLPAHLAARLDMQPDPTLGPGTAELSWGDGGLVFDPRALLAQTLAVIDPLGIDPLGIDPPVAEDTRS